MSQINHIRQLDSGRVMIEICKWCYHANSTCVIENACLCDTCAQIVRSAQKTPGLCDLCSSLFTDREVLGSLISEDGFSHKDLRSLQISTQQGCQLCRLFLLQDPNEDGNRLIGGPLRLYADVAASDCDGNKPDQDVCADICSLYFSSEPGVYELRLSVSAALDDPASENITQRPVPRYLGNEETFKQIREWLDSSKVAVDKPLLRNQKVCRLPSRVIDVGVDSNAIPRLFEPSSTTYDEYVALSYCWGRERFTTTTLDSISTHKQGLDLCNLPQVFLDAFITTRALGFRYIWIDALCIIQDCVTDKLQEIGQMGDIFSNAAFCIAAVSGERATDGFLRVTWEPLSVKLPYKCADGNMGSVLVTPQLTVDMWQEPLFTRAWTLQETMLCPRILYFTKNDILCQSRSGLSRCSSNTHVTYLRDSPEFHTSPFYRIPASTFAELSDLSITNDKSIGDYQHYRVWASLVENYTRRKLTMLEDRLPAIGGIAQSLGNAWTDEYYAGLWKAFLVDSLAWRRHRKRIPGQYTTVNTYRAPTWSWASIEGPVEFAYGWHAFISNRSNLKAELIACQTVPATENGSLFGQLRAGELTLRASCIRCRGSILTDLTSVQGWGDIYPDYLDDESGWSTLSEKHLEESWFLLLGSGPDGSGGKQIRTLALILMPVADGKFERFGLFDTTYKGAHRAWASPKDRRVVTII